METPDVTTIYYVFSTIAQTLAGIVGILAAFAIMRLSDLSRRLEELLCQLGKNSTSPTSFYAHMDNGDFESALGLIDHDSISGTDLTFTASACGRAVRERKKLLATLKSILLITGLVIVFSVLNMIFAMWIKESQALTWTMLTIGLIGLTWILGRVGALVAQLGWNRERESRNMQRKRTSGARR